MIDNRKILDCIPFYQGNLLFELRLKTLNHLVDKFVEMGCQVSIIDNLSTGKLENINPDKIDVQPQRR